MAKFSGKLALTLGLGLEKQRMLSQQHCNERISVKNVGERNFRKRMEKSHCKFSSPGKTITTENSACKNITFSFFIFFY